MLHALYRAPLHPTRASLASACPHPLLPRPTSYDCPTHLSTVAAPPPRAVLTIHFLEPRAIPFPAVLCCLTRSPGAAIHRSPDLLCTACWPPPAPLLAPASRCATLQLSFPFHLFQPCSTRCFPLQLSAPILPFIQPAARSDICTPKPAARCWRGGLPAAPFASFPAPQLNRHFISSASSRSCPSPSVPPPPAPLHKRYPPRANSFLHGPSHFCSPQRRPAT